MVDLRLADPERRRQRIGVLGGAFDPPHIGHVAVAQTAVQQLQLDGLHIIPTGQAWHKTRTLTAGVHRLAMARLAFLALGTTPLGSTQTHLGVTVQVDDRELRRGGPTYSVDTLRELALQYPGAALYLCLGEDQALALTSWHEWQALVKLAIICVAARPDEISVSRHFLSETVAALPLSAPTPSLLQRLTQRVPQGRFELLNLAHMPISATAIRLALAQHRNVAPLVGEPVARYIATHHLYHSA